MLIIKDGTIKLVNIRNASTTGKILDMVPDLINKFTGKGDSSVSVEKAEDADEAEEPS